jgi:uncharacterized cupin superfamily protein
VDNQITVFHNDKKRIITRTSEYCFIIEGESQYLKWSMTDPPKSVEFQNGPRLTLDNDFYGKGKISKIEPVEVSDKLKKAVKVTVII